MPKPSRSDIRLYVPPPLRQGWNIPTEMRIGIITMLGEIATDKDSTRRERTSAARALMQASRVELDAIRARRRALREYVEAAGCVGGEDRCRTGGRLAGGD